jgi:hypothetical protein
MVLWRIVVRSSDPPGALHRLKTVLTLDDAWDLNEALDLQEALEKRAIEKR